MKKLSATYNKLGIAFTFPIDIEDEKGNSTYYETSDGFWLRCEYDEKGNLTYYGDSNGWYRREYDENGNKTYYEDSNGTKKGTKRGSCDGKVIEVDGKKYKLTEL